MKTTSKTHKKKEAIDEEAFIYVPADRRKPFKPNSYHCVLADANKLFAKEKPIVEKEIIVPSTEFENLVDAETGEIISVTKSKWNAKEGRVNMDTKTILLMGTGKLDIKNRIPIPISKSGSNIEIIQPTSRTGSSKGTSSTMSPFISPLQSPHRSPDKTPRSRHNSLPPLSSSQSLSPVRTTPDILAEYISSPLSQSQSIQQSSFSPSRQSSAHHSAAQSTSTSRLQAHLPEQFQSPQRIFAVDAKPKPRHPLVTQFLLEGPINPRNHRYWNKRSDSIDINNSNYEEVKEEDAYYEEWELQQYSNKYNDTVTDDEIQFLTQESDDYSQHSMQSLNSRNRVGNMGSRLQIDTDIRSVNSYLTTNSKGSKTSNKIAEPSYHHIAQKLVPTNVDNWLAVEENIFRDIFNLAGQMETNKSLTKEAPLKGGMHEVKRNCRTLARLRVKCMKEIVQAIEDEKRKEKLRENAELENMHKPQALQDILRKANHEERKKGRLYLTALQTDSEIQFIHMMTEFGYLW